MIRTFNHRCHCKTPIIGQITLKEWPSFKKTNYVGCIICGSRMEKKK